MIDVNKAPFPWFGGKKHAAPHVWSALGDVDHYVEPFAGSLAVLLQRPFKPVPSRAKKEESAAVREAIQRFLLDRRVATLAEVTEACRCSEAVARRALEGFAVWSAASGVWRVRK